MSLTLFQLEDARRALEKPLFADLPGDVALSCELFPPRAVDEGFLETVDRLAAIGPRFVSVTCGAGGSEQSRTHGLVTQLSHRLDNPVAAHLTCVGASREDIAALAGRYWQAGVRHIVALRGDGGRPGEDFVPHPEGYADPAELIAGLRAQHPFEISVAAYPEVHPKAVSAAADLDVLKRKVDAGATRALTQFFFSPDTFFRFRDAAVAAGITAEIVPGILPIASVAQTRRFAAACGAQIPQWLDALLDGLDDSPAARALVSATLSAELCRQLYAGGVRAFHLYTLNRPELSEAIAHLLGVRKPVAARQELAA